MRLYSTIKVMVVNKVQGEYNGNATFKIGVLQGDELGSIKATEDAFKGAVTGKENTFELAYSDGQYGGIRLTRVLYGNDNAPKGDNKN